MSYCAPCSTLSPIEICTTEIIIGTAEADTLYYIYFRSLANGWTVKYEATSDGDGLIVLESEDGFVLAENTGYKIWINQTDNIDDREEFTSGGLTNECFTTSFMRQAPTPTTLSKLLYINGDVLGDNTKETALKTFLSAKGITCPIFYLSTYLDDSGNRTKMRTLNSALNTQGVLKRSANVTQSVNAITLLDAGTPAAYNVGCATAAEKFNVFSQEWEFWKTNPYGDFATFKTNDLAIYNYCQANGIQYDIYVARCKDVAGVSTPAQVADWLVAYHEVIYLVDYVSTSKFNTYKGLSDGIKVQIGLIADAAKRASKVQKMVILWASEGNSGDNMYTYFVANPTLIPAYNTFKTAYNSWSFTNKTSINMQGQNIYAYDSIKAL